MPGLSLVAASGSHSSSQCAGPSLSWPLLLRSTGSRRTASVVVAHGPSCSVACGIFPDQGSNPCPLHWQADSQPLRHQGSPEHVFLNLSNLLWLWCHSNVPKTGTIKRSIIYYEYFTVLEYNHTLTIFQMLISKRKLPCFLFSLVKSPGLGQRSPGFQPLLSPPPLPTIC